MNPRAIFMSTLMALIVFIIAVSDSYGQNPFFPKPDLLLTHIKTPIEITPGEEIGGRVEVTFYNNGIAPVEGGYRIDFFISRDRKLREIVPGPSDTYVEDVMLEGGRTGEFPGLETEESYFYTHPRLKIMNDIPIGSYQICAFIDPDDIIDEDDGRRNFLCAPIHIIPGDDHHTDPVEDPVEGPINNIPRRSVNSGDLESYDADGDCLLSDAEFFDVTDDWTRSLTAGSTFFAAIDAWMSQSDICTAVGTAASARNAPISIETSALGVVFSSAINEVLDLVVYDVSGREVFSHSSLSGRIYWNLRTQMGDQVPNGVYFVSFGTHEVRKIAVVR